MDEHEWRRWASRRLVLTQCAPQMIWYVQSNFMHLLAWHWGPCWLSLQALIFLGDQEDPKWYQNLTSNQEQWRLLARQQEQIQLFDQEQGQTEIFDWEQRQTEMFDQKQADCFVGLPTKCLVEFVELVTCCWKQRIT